jgi:hypothetical protein
VLRFTFRARDRVYAEGEEAWVAIEAEVGTTK